MEIEIGHGKSRKNVSLCVKVYYQIQFSWQISLRSVDFGEIFRFLNHGFSEIICHEKVVKLRFSNCGLILFLFVLYTVLFLASISSTIMHVILPDAEAQTIGNVLPSTRGSLCRGGGDSPQHRH